MPGAGRGAVWAASAATWKTRKGRTSSFRRLSGQSPEIRRRVAGRRAGRAGRHWRERSQAGAQREIAEDANAVPEPVHRRKSAGEMNDLAVEVPRSRTRGRDRPGAGSMPGPVRRRKSAGDCRPCAPVKCREADPRTAATAGHTPAAGGPSRGGARSAGWSSCACGRAPKMGAGWGLCGKVGVGVCEGDLFIEGPATPPVWGPPLAPVDFFLAGRDAPRPRPPPPGGVANRPHDRAPALPREICCPVLRLRIGPVRRNGCADSEKIVPRTILGLWRRAGRPFPLR